MCFMSTIFETLLPVYAIQPFNPSTSKFLTSFVFTQQQDFANPEVAKHLNFYPEEVEGSNPISEVWQAEQ